MYKAPQATELRDYRWNHCFVDEEQFNLTG